MTNSTDRISQLHNLTLKSGHGPAITIVPLTTGSGSGRQYFRIETGKVNLVGTYNANKPENAAFLYLTTHFLEHGLPVPRVLACSDNGLYYLQEDLGDESLYTLMAGGYNAAYLPLLQKSLEWLVQFQVKGATGLDYTRCYPGTPFDREGALRDLLYFKYMFLRLSGLEPDEAVLDKEFDVMLDHLFGDYVAGFMYRDFQSRNIMVQHGMLWFIDYQGGRLGPLAYDAASLLYQSRLGLPADAREELILHYIEALSEYITLDISAMQQQVKSFAVLRLLQTLGAYGFRGLFERKEAFIKPIPAALENTLDALQSLPSGSLLPHLNELLSEALAKFSTGVPQQEGLTIAISSFSYMHGLPPDSTGNGGGFIFDCRALPNPHRDPMLRPFTGMDPQVAEWLAKKPEVQEFLSHCEALVMQSADNYLQRGFSHLQVNFGCTGGKHRSVYCAEALRKQLMKSGLKITVKLHHSML